MHPKLSVSVWSDGSVWSNGFVCGPTGLTVGWWVCLVWSGLTGLWSGLTELEAQVSTAEEERRALVERCLDSERQLERQKAAAVELRRKLDDTTAALQELARENQLLQVRQPALLTAPPHSQRKDTAALAGTGDGGSLPGNRRRRKHYL